MTCGCMAAQTNWWLLETGDTGVPLESLPPVHLRPSTLPV
jgi:hypothetical protein